MKSPDLRLTGAVVTTALTGVLGVSASEASPAPESKNVPAAQAAGGLAVEKTCSVDQAAAYEDLDYVDNVIKYQFPGRLVYKAPKKPIGSKLETYLPIYESPSEETTFGKGNGADSIASNSKKVYIVDKPYIFKAKNGIQYAMQTEEDMECGYTVVDLKKAKKMGALDVYARVGQRSMLEPASTTPPHYEVIDSMPSQHNIENDAVAGKYVRFKKVNYIPHV